MTADCAMQTDLMNFQNKKSKLVMEKLKKTLERLFWKRKYIRVLERQIRSLKAEYSVLERKLSETERLNRGLTSDLVFYKKKYKKSKKGGAE